MAIGIPIILNFYDSDDEVIATYSRATITGRIFERALDLQEFSAADVNPKDVLNAMDQLIVDFYGGKFTIDQLKDSATPSEKNAVVAAIISHAVDEFREFDINLNPTKPGKTQNPRRKRKPGSSS